MLDGVDGITFCEVVVSSGSIVLGVSGIDSREQGASTLEVLFFFMLKVGCVGCVDHPPHYLQDKFAVVYLCGVGTSPHEMLMVVAAITVLGQPGEHLR